MGLGRMGSLMAANVARAGFPMRLYNRTRAVADDFAAAHGGSPAATPRELAEGSDLVLSMLADGDALIETYTNPDGVLEGLARGTVAIDMGTSGTDAVRLVREKVEARGSEFIDAPVSGSTPAAEAGQLLIMVGGSEHQFERVTPLLEAIGSPVLVGPPGSGAALKLTVNSILYGLNQALAEGVVLAERVGVKPEIALDILARSAAGAPLVTYRKPQYLAPDIAPVMFTLELARKDLGLALEEARALGVAMPQLERTMEIVEQLIADGEGKRDIGFVVEGARRRARD
ncbi:MAG TPA: NAD(P)-dependent oxidoreductase [Acidimicrobiia bacterium]|nr:NAD(P)-dependent oxidoreductase [Acidimicrobiia bacterium]